MQTDPPQNQINDITRLYHAGYIEKAEHKCQELLEVYPQSSILNNALGITLQGRSKFKKAIVAFSNAIHLNPHYAKAYANRGVALQKLYQVDDALENYNKAIQLDSGYMEAYYNRGVVLQDLGRSHEAISSYNKAIQLNPDYARSYNSLGTVLYESGDFNEAIDNYNKAIQLNPDYAEAYNNLGAALQSLGKLNEAVNNYNKAIQLKPYSSELQNNIGVVFQKLGKFDKATSNYNKAIQLKPDDVEAHFNLGLLLLLQGNFKDGWEKYEYRCRDKNYSIPIHNLTQPQWDGSALKGRTLLIYVEQGLGDTFQFSRYLHHIKKDGGSIVFMCQSTVIDFYRGNDSGWDIYIDKVISADDPLPHFDLHISLMSLPYIMDTNINNIPQGVPYIKTRQDMAHSWKLKIKKEHIKNIIKVGLVWQGSKTHKNDHYRSIPLECFSSLLELDKVKLFSLQRGFGQEQIAKNNFENNIIDWSSNFGQYINTAALIENLDLVISIDTSIVHLAGAMGKPVWVLLEAVPDFRWMLDHEDSPWYPSAKLFRQQDQGNWETVISKVKKELENLISKT